MCPIFCWFSSPHPRPTGGPFTVSPLLLCPPQVRLRTRTDCELEVSMYPTFAYNAVGGGGHATAEDLGNGLLRLVFDPQVSRGGDVTAEVMGSGLLRLVFVYFTLRLPIGGGREEHRGRRPLL